MFCHRTRKGRYYACAIVKRSSKETGQWKHGSAEAAQSRLPLIKNEGKSAVLRVAKYASQLIEDLDAGALASDRSSVDAALQPDAPIHSRKTVFLKRGK